MTTAQGETYAEYIDRVLKPCARHPATKVVDLFAGCGGLALGFEASGFETHGFEMNQSAVDTYKKNLSGACSHLKLTRGTPLPAARVLIGGPPCQPFSVGGNQNGVDDERNGIPLFVSAVERVQPEVFLFENVRGMLYRNHTYFNTVLEKLRQLGYVVEARLLNAVDFGVPQNRERLIVVGFVKGLAEDRAAKHIWRWPVPEPNRITAGQALGELATQVPPDSKFLTASMDAYVAKYEKASKCINPRDLHLNRPARTLTCRNLAGATGDMQRIHLPDGRRRRLTVQEAARLQSFPTWFRFSGTETEQFNQIGNAVAPLFAFHLAQAVRQMLDTSSQERP